MSEISHVLSCCFRDEVGGANVNLLPSDKPADIYQVVADKTTAKLEARKNDDSNSVSQEEDEVTDAQLAQWWLDFGISRKVTKRNCMTFPYGVVSKPADIYQVVADKTIIKLNALTVPNCAKREMGQEEDEVTDADLAQ